MSPTAMVLQSQAYVFDARPDYERWMDEFYDLAEEHGYDNIDEFIWPSPYPEVRHSLVACTFARAGGTHVGMEYVLMEPFVCFLPYTRTTPQL